jgi:aspartate/methionine/tyrosine aminotransferase
MTGWRLGYGIMPITLAKQLAKVAGNCTSCTAAFTQLAGVEALEGSQDEVEAMIEEFRARRDLIVEGLNQLPGFRCHRPLGAFYAFPNITGTGMSSKELGNFLMENAGVATLPGITFGESGEGFIRFSYAASRDDLSTAIEQLSKALSKGA